LYPAYSPAGDRLIASLLRANESIQMDPRREWSAQQPDTLDMKVTDDTWMVPSAWSPDGRQLVGTVVNKAGSPIGVGVYDVTSRTARMVAKGSSTFLGFVWLPDSRRALYGDTDTDTLWLVDVESGSRKALATGLKLGLGLAASPDRRTLYASIARQQADLWMIDMKGAR